MSKGAGDKVVANAVRTFAEQLATTREVRLPDSYHLGHAQFQSSEEPKEEDLTELERLLNVLEAYLWLSGKFE